MASDSLDPKPTLLSMTKQLVSRNASRFTRPAAPSSGATDGKPSHVALTAEEVLSEMEGANDEVLARLALEPACPESVLTTFVNGPRAALRAAAARNPRLNLGLLSMLAQNSQEEEPVLLAVAEHPSTSPESLRRLAGSAYLSVRMAAALHPSTPLDALLLLAGASDIPVQLALATRADLPVEVQRALLKAAPSTEVLRALASGPFVNEDILAALATSVEPDIRLRTAVHPRLPVGSQQLLSADPDWSVRQAAMSVSREDEGGLTLHLAVQPAAIQDPVVDDRTYLEFLTAEQQQELQDLIQALEALNSEALEFARQQWLSSLDRPRTVDEQRLRAAHQGRVLELERESRLTLERDLRILRQNLQAEADREKRGTSLSLSKALEQERQALSEELKTRRARQLLEERSATEQRRMEDLAALRAQQATEQQRTLAAERTHLTSELERFLEDQRALLQADASGHLQTVRIGLEQKLQAELAALRERMQAQFLKDLSMLRAAEDERTAARQLELESALERLLDDQRLQLQAETDERWAQEKEVFTQAMEARLAEQELQAQVIRRERLTSEHARQRAELEVQSETLLHEWRRAAGEALSQRQEQWEAETKQAQSDLTASLKAEREQRLVQQRQQLEAEWSVREAELRAAHGAALIQELEALAEQSRQSLVEHQAEAGTNLGTHLDLQIERLTAELAQERHETLTTREQRLISAGEPGPAPLSTPLTGATSMVGTLVGGYLVPAELLPTNQEPVLEALRLILTHLDVQEAALARLAPDGQSHRVYLRTVNRVIEGFMHGQENVILRADREDGPHYFCNERVPRLMP